MNPPNGYQQAYLELEGSSEQIPCWFNPKEYTISKSNGWNTPKIVGASLPPAQFTGGDPRQLKLDLIFDDSDDENGDVRKVTDLLFKMMEVDAQRHPSGNRNRGRPSAVTFHWGDVITFKAVCTQLSVQFTLFRPNGVPIRSTANMQLTQVETIQDRRGGGRKKPPQTATAGANRQNPTTTGLAGLRSHVVRDGDSLPWLAYGAYGDATKWRTIAEANGIDDPLAVRRGTTLSIPTEPE